MKWCILIFKRTVNDFGLSVLLIATSLLTYEESSPLLTQQCRKCVDESEEIFLSMNKFLISCSIMKDNRKVLQF